MVKMNYNAPTCPSAYCKLHKWQLSYRQIKKMGCTNPKKQQGKAQCYYLRKYLDHPVWVGKERRREERGVVQG